MFTVREILKVVKGSSIVQRPASSVKGISIDSRTVKPGELFIPIKGSKFDGHKFIADALKKGAMVLEVKDGLQALQALAAYHRRKVKIPVIGITGSVGKTTTKDMLASILAQEMPVLKNEENFNNEIGVPLTLLKLTKKHKYAVIEMAMQGLGEIDLLAKIVRPHIAIVTNIGEGTYDSIYLWKAAVDKAGTLDKEAMIDALPDVSFNAPQGEISIEAGSNHARLHQLIAETNADGSFTVLEDFGLVDPISNCTI